MNRRKRINGVLLTSVSAIGIGFASAAMADGSATYLDQIGDNQSAAIDQSGSTSGATVGTSTNPFYQTNGAGTGGNVLVINQNSGSNSELANIASLVAVGSGNSVTGFQSGTDNNAEIDQMGSNSSVLLEQTGANNGAVGIPFTTPNFWTNSPYGNVVVQDSTSDGSRVELVQTTAVTAPLGNTFSIGQGGIDNLIDVEQTGYNKLWVRQGSGAPDLWPWTWGNPFDPSSAIGPANSLSMLDNSTITVIQDTTIVGDPFARNYAALGQGGGTVNSLTVHQYGASNAAIANQVGSNNTFSSIQTNLAAGADWNFVGGEAGWPGGMNPVTGVLNDFRPIEQIGDNNEYYSTQSGTNLWALGNQKGNFLTLTNSQSGDVNKLFSIQSGDNNDISNTQTGDDGTATYNQSGSYNVATLQDQKGTFNSVNVTQTGTGTVGNENTVTMLQNGDGSSLQVNSITMLQSGGGGNAAYLVQGGTFSGGPLTATTLTAGAAGHGNTIVGSQAGDDNYAATSQNGDGNVANFSQTGTGNVTTITQ